MNLKLRTRMALGLLGSGLVLTLSAAGSPVQPRLRASTEAPAKAPGRNATELEEQLCQENAYRGEPPASGDCAWIPDGPITEDDVWGRWDCRTMGILACTPPPTGWLTFELGRTG